MALCGITISSNPMLEQLPSGKPSGNIYCHEFDKGAIHSQLFDKCLIYFFVLRSMKNDKFNKYTKKVNVIKNY